MRKTRLLKTGEKRKCCCSNPVTAIANLLGAVSGIYGLWMHDWIFIIAAILFFILGHAYIWAAKKEAKRY